MGSQRSLALILWLKAWPNMTHFLDFRPNVRLVVRGDLAQNPDLLRDGEIESAVYKSIDFFRIIR